jgi:hypothetical protein
MGIISRRRLHRGITVASMTAWMLIPGCVIHIGADGVDEEPSPNGGSRAGGGGGEVGSGGGTGEPSPTFDDIDPQQLALIEAKASITTAYLVATAESMGIDPMTFDQADFEQLMQAHMSAASADAELWLSTLDPSTIHVTGNEPNDTCYSQYQCEYSSRCKYNAPPVPHTCWATDCGRSKCSLCPSWVTDLLKSLVITTWCAYVCTDKVTKQPVAIGAAGISAFKGYWIGPICKAL